jgi:trehalose 2-sulfotransferase
MKNVRARAVIGAVSIVPWVSGFEARSRILATQGMDMNIPNADVAQDVDVSCVRSYLICASPRTGSTLLSSMLMDTALAGQPFEFMHELSMREFFTRVGRPLELEEYVDFLKERRCSQNGVFGFKAQFEQLGGMFPDHDIQAKFIRSFDRFVVVYRRNVLAQAISCYKAMLTGVWHETAEAGLSAQGAIAEAYDAAEIAKYLAAMIDQPESWRRLLAKCGVDWLEIAYEDLSEDPVGMLNRVTEYLDIDIGALPKAPSPRLCRQSDEVSREWGERFVADVLGVPAPGALYQGEEPEIRPMRGRKFAHS